MMTDESKVSAAESGASIRMMAVFLRAVEGDKMTEALELAHAILRCEPSNRIMLEYREYLTRYLKNEADGAVTDSGSDSESDSGNSSEDDSSADDSSQASTDEDTTRSPSIEHEVSFVHTAQLTLNLITVNAVCCCVPLAESQQLKELSLIKRLLFIHATSAGYSSRGKRRGPFGIAAYRPESASCTSQCSRC